MSEPDKPTGAGAEHSSTPDNQPSHPQTPNHWATLEGTGEIRRALRDLLGLVAAGKLEAAKAKEMRANLESQLKFALAREEKAKPPKRAKPADSTGLPDFSDLEASEELAVQAAHKAIAKLATKDDLTSRDIRQLRELHGIITATKSGELKAFELRKRFGQADPDRAREISKQVAPAGPKEDQ